MPNLDTSMHLDMLNVFKRSSPFRARLTTVLRRSLIDRKVYGVLDWGDPEQADPLKFVRDRYLLPYVKPEQTALEIGPGGGAGHDTFCRSTSYMWWTSTMTCCESCARAFARRT